MTRRAVGWAGEPRERHVSGFTMVELMVVLVVLAILATIALGLASRVTESGKQSLTKNTIRGLDQVMTDFKAERGTRPPAWVETDRTMVNTYITSAMSEAEQEEYDTRRYKFPLIDGRFDGRANDINGDGLAAATRWDPALDPVQPSGALFLLLAAEEAGSVDAILKGIDSGVVKRRDVWAYGWRLDDNGDPIGQPEHRRLRIPVIVDGYGEPIRLVHPSFDGGSGEYWAGGGLTSRASSMVDPTLPTQPPNAVAFTRSYRPFDPGTAQGDAVGDADEGICPGKNPYFYSGGGDKDPGTRADNAYGVEPRFPDDTMQMK